MKIATRLILAFLLVIAAGFWCLVTWVRDDVKPRALESLEEPLVDTAWLLASLVSAQSGNEAIRTDGLRAACDRASRERFSATIHGTEKTRVDLRVYVTDVKGTVVFDSDGGRDEGKDYSRWNDVYLTLNGRYGVRTTRVVPGDPSTSILYVAAPVRIGGRIAGVLTVCKPKGTVNAFIRNAKRKIVGAGVATGAAAALLGAVVLLAVTRPVRRLTRYVRAVRDGRPAAAPRLGGGEIGELGRAVEEMRDSLEGKKHVERYMQTLAHEVKSPITAALGAAELLEEEMPRERRARFIENIRAELTRIRDVVERLLQLSAIEARKTLDEAGEIDLAAIVADVAARLAPLLEAKGLSIAAETAGAPAVRGDRLLLAQAVENLIRNAIDFSPRGGTIRVLAARAGSFAEIAVEDEGPGIPAYAAGRVFDRFYSLPRPGTGRKSSGLGLSIVREIAALHGGAVSLDNRPAGGARAALRLPLFSTEVRP